MGNNEKINRASRTEEQVGADKAKSRIFNKARKGTYRAAVSGLYCKRFRGCLEAKMDLAMAKYSEQLGLNVDEFGGAYKSMNIHDRGEDARGDVVAAF